MTRPSTSPPQIRRTHLASKTKEHEFGTFYHELISVSLADANDTCLVGDELDDFLRDNPDPDVRVHRAISDLAFIHEFRHFHDCFGTHAGVSLFFLHVDTVLRFLDTCRTLAEKKITWKLPLADWLLQRDCPDEVRAFAHMAFRRTRVRAAFMGSVVPPPLEGKIVAPYVEFRVPGVRGSFPAYPLDGGIILAGATAPFWPVVPLGFECLIEGSAQAIQRTLLESVWPKDVAERAWTAMTRFELPAGHAPEELLSEATGRVLPYNITDYMVTRHVRTRCGRESFERDMLLFLSDEVLMRASIASDTCVHPGWMFVDLMQAMDWSRSEKQEVGNTLPPRTDAALLEAVETPPAPADFITNGSLPHGPRAVAFIESFVRHEIVAPLLRWRLQRGDVMFQSVSGYLESVAHLPRPPFVLRGNVLTSSTRDEIHRCWAEFVMIQSILEAILHNEPIVNCARAHDSIPGIGHYDLAFEGTCNEHVRARRCLTWSPGRLGRFPRCLFSNLIRVLGLERAAQAR
jgi:hypothetical protein